MRLGNSYIGAPVERVEDLRFLRGRGEYIDDIRREGQWHATIFRSFVAHAKIRSIDASAALAMPGVHAVLNGRVRMPRPDQHRAAPYQQPVIADGVARYVGEPVAVILAAGDARSTRGMGSRNRPIALGQPDSLVYFGSG
jgi:carbon-monoxide dehydrogenase large subunit